MKQVQFIQLLQGILSKVIDETEDKALKVNENDIPDNDIDLYSFNFLSDIFRDMSNRYVKFKQEYESEDTYARRLNEYNEVMNQEMIETDDEDNNGNGGLH